MNEVKSLDTTEQVRGAEKKEQFHQEAESRIQTFHFETPTDKPKDRTGYFWLCQSDLMRGMIQMIPEGGDINLHYHPGKDGFWMVLKGRARFYGPTENIIGEFGPMDGVLMPRNSRYWFESCSEEELYILLVTGSNLQKTKSRVDVVTRSPDRVGALHYNYPEGSKGGGE